MSKTSIFFFLINAYNEMFLLYCGKDQDFELLLTQYLIPGS